jgi:hypothetical protein
MQGLTSVEHMNDLLLDYFGKTDDRVTYAR